MDVKVIHLSRDYEHSQLCLNRGMLCVHGTVWSTISCYTRYIGIILAEFSDVGSTSIKRSGICQKKIVMAFVDIQKKLQAKTATHK